jgi:hypothetical protein
MTPAAIATPTKESPLLFEGLTWREFKAVEQTSPEIKYALPRTLVEMYQCYVSTFFFGDV